MPYACACRFPHTIYLSCISIFVAISYIYIRTLRVLSSEYYHPRPLNREDVIMESEIIVISNIRGKYTTLVFIEVWGLMYQSGTCGPG